MKKTFALLFLLTMTAFSYGQVIAFSTIDTLPMEYWVSLDGYTIRGAVHCIITNDDERDSLKVEIVSVSDTSDFIVSGIISPIPPRNVNEETPQIPFLKSNQRRLDIIAKRLLGHDTTLTIVFRTNDRSNTSPKLVIHGRKNENVLSIADDLHPGASELYPTSVIRGSNVVAPRNTLVWDAIGRGIYKAETGIIYTDCFESGVYYCTLKGKFINRLVIQ